MQATQLDTVPRFIERVTNFKTHAAIEAGRLDELVETSVYLTWKHGDISPVNAVIDATSVIKGLNRRALVTFYRDVIPFTYSTEKEQFTKADSNKVQAMGGQLGNGHDDACGKQVMLKIESTTWHSFNKERVAKPYVFNVQRIIGGLTAQLRKGYSGKSLHRDDLVKLNNTVGALVKEFNDLLEVQETESTAVMAEAIKKSA